MGFNITLDDKFIKETNKFLSKVETDVLFKAAKASINRTAKATATRAIKEIRKKVYKLKVRDVKSILKVHQASGFSLSGLEASIRTKARGPGAIRFVKGDPSSLAKQKGIPLKSRKKLKMEVRPGRRLTLKSRFVVKTKSNNFGVFRRLGSRSQPIEFQRLPQLSKAFFDKSHFRQPLITFAGRRMDKEFGRTFKFMLDRQIARQSAKG